MARDVCPDPIENQWEEGDIVKGETLFKGHSSGKLRGSRPSTEVWSGPASSPELVAKDGRG
jgi:hypothetical protein